MIYKIQDGDILKILPIINKDGSASWGRHYTTVYNNEKFIYDNSGKDYLNRIACKVAFDSSRVVHNRFAFNCYINKEIKIVSLSRSIIDIIKNSEPLCISDNKHLFIKIKLNKFPNYYKESYIDNYNWEIPVLDPDSKEEWTNWIKSNQPDFEGFLEENNVFNNINELKILFGSDLLSEIISEDRDKKIVKIIADGGNF